MNIREYVVLMKKKHPSIAEMIDDSYEMMNDEIMDGSSSDLEEERFYVHVDELVKEAELKGKTKKKKTASKKRPNIRTN